MRNIHALKPHQRQSFITAYMELTKNIHFLNQLVEFTAKYRFLNLLDEVDSPIRKLFFDYFYESYLAPFHVLFSQHSIKNGEQKIHCLNTIVDLMIKNIEHNDQWAVMLVIEVYRKPFCWQLYRNLFEEVPLHNRKLLTYSKLPQNKKPFINISLKKLINKKLLDKNIYMGHNMPAGFTLYMSRSIIIPISIIIGAATWASLTFSKAQSYFLPVFLLVVSIILIFTILRLFSLINGVLPLSSHLTTEGLPNHIKAGLLDEISGYIQQQIDSYAIVTPKFSPPPEQQLPLVLKSAPVSNTELVLSPAANTAPAETGPKDGRKKTHSPFASLFYGAPNSTPNPRPIYRWHTKQYGEVTYQSGRASDNIFPLWSGNKNFCNRHVVLFPRKHLENKNDEPMITAFWQTACFGQIAHSKNQSGYMHITNQEKTNKDYKLPPEAKFKLKTFHTGYASYRMPIIPCELESSDSNGLELLVAISPVKTH